MTKRGEALAATISEFRPLFDHHGPYLFLRNPKLFLRGFAFDAPPGGCYLWKYMFPLFSTDDFITLTFGYRLEGGYINMRGASNRSVVNSLIAQIDRSLDFCQIESIDEFLSFLETPELSSETRKEALALIQHYQQSEALVTHKIIEQNIGRYLS